MNFYLYKKKLIKNFNIEKFGYICFLSGIFFLASAVGISILLLLISVIISFQKPYDFIKDKWNYPLLLCGILMLISTCIHFGRYEQYVDLGIDPKLSLIGLFNWLPFFFLFLGISELFKFTKKKINYFKSTNQWLYTSYFLRYSSTLKY